MHTYHRPPLNIPEFRDATGAVIEYGNRWRGESPPDNSYSVDSNLERFAPLHTVADALIRHLRESFDVTLSTDPPTPSEFLFEPEHVTRTARLTPSDPDAAPLTFLFTSFPGVLLHAGILHDFAFPVCGCDACDDTAEGQAEQLEWTTLAVVSGGFRENVTAGLSPRVGMSLDSADGQGRQRGETLATGIPRARLTSARSRLNALPDGWRTWPPAPAQS